MRVYTGNIMYITRLFKETDYIRVIYRLYTGYPSWKPNPTNYSVRFESTHFIIIDPQAYNCQL